jgi:hypothetical protein
MNYTFKKVTKRQSLPKGAVVFCDEISGSGDEVVVRMNEGKYLYFENRDVDDLEIGDEVMCEVKP